MPSSNILGYFKKLRGQGSCAEESSLPSAAETGISRNVIKRVNENLAIAPEKKRRQTYTPVIKATIARYAMVHRNAAAIQKFRKDFPGLNDSTIRRFRAEYKKEAAKRGDMHHVTELPGKKKGRPPQLPEELMRDFEKWIQVHQEKGNGINVHTINAVIMGLIEGNVAYKSYLDFVPTRGWRRALYVRLNLSRRRATTGRPPISKAAFKEISIKFHHSITSLVRMHSIPDQLIVTLDQTPSKYVEVSKTTMAPRNAKHVAVTNTNDKRAITITLSITLSGEILPYQLIYGGKTKRCLPAQDLFPKGFLLSYNPNHWSNEKETQKLLTEVLIPYFTEKKKALGLPQTHKSMIIWDDFRGHKTEATLELCEENNIVIAQIPPNFTHLLSPLDLTVNKKLKHLEQEDFSKYYSTAIANSVRNNPGIDVSELNIDKRLSTLKPLHAASITRSYHFFNSEGRSIILNGWRAAGITAAVARCRCNDWEGIVDPFAVMSLD